jgi:hypothetical protein
MSPSRLLGAFLVSIVAVNASEPVIVPDKVIPLFNGKDLSHFFTWDIAHGRANTDRVFTAVEQVTAHPPFGSAASILAGSSRTRAMRIIASSRNFAGVC